MTTTAVMVMQEAMMADGTIAKAGEVEFPPSVEKLPECTKACACALARAVPRAVGS
jgi:hypothetical protein